MALKLVENGGQMLRSSSSDPQNDSRFRTDLCEMKSDTVSTTAKNVMDSLLDETRDR